MCLKLSIFGWSELSPTLPQPGAPPCPSDGYESSVTAAAIPLLCLSLAKGITWRSQDSWFLGWPSHYRMARSRSFSPRSGPKSPMSKLDETG